MTPGKSTASLKASPADARPRNRTMLLQALIDQGPTSRADLARISGLTPTTVSAVTAELIADGLVEEVGRKQTATAGPGKPATLLAVEPDGRHVVALDLSDDETIEAAVVNLAGKIVERRSVPRHNETGAKATQAVVKVAKEMAKSVQPHQLLGIGVATPGVVGDDGVVINAAHVQWNDEPLAQRIATATNTPVHVTNDANAAVLAEYSGTTQDPQNLMLVRVGGGVGAGIVIDGHLYTGDHHAAGEIGHVIVDDSGPQCKCGRHGCLEAIVSAPLLAQRLTGVDDEERARYLDQAGRHLGLALATLVGALDLAEIVLSGPMDLLDDRFRIAALETIRHRTFPAVGQHVTARFSSLGDDGVLLGAAALVMRRELGVV